MLKGSVNQYQFQRLLQDSLASAKNKNSRYSLRAFSRRIGLKPSAVSEIIRGKRDVSSKLAERVVSLLDISTTERQSVFLNGEQTISPQYQILRADEFSLISEWQHFAILSLLEVQKVKGSSKTIAGKLGLAHSRVLRSLKRLERLKLVELVDDRWLMTGRKFHSTDGISDLSVRRSHFESLELAQRSLERHSIIERDFTSLTFRMNPKKLVEVRKLIRKFREQVSRITETPDAEEVYKICIQLFPLSQSFRAPKESL